MTDSPADMTAEQLRLYVYNLNERACELERSVEAKEVALRDRSHESELLRNSVARLSEGVLITDDELDWPGPRIVFVNEEMCRITGYSAEELIGQSPRIMQGEQTDRATLDRLKAELSAGGSSVVELVNYRKDGTPYDAELFITPLFNAEGRRTNFVSVHRDVTVQRCTENAFRESEERFRLFMDNSPTVAWM